MGSHTYPAAIAGITNLQSDIDDIVNDIAIIDHHWHSRTRVYPQVAGATITLVSDGSADTFGSWVNIIPINTVDFEYEVTGLVIYGVDVASNYFIQLGLSLTDDSTTPTIAQILGERELKLIDTPIKKATVILDFLADTCPANSKLWGRLKTDGGNTDEAYIAVVLSRHAGNVSGHIANLVTWPWST